MYKQFHEWQKDEQFRESADLFVAARLGSLDWRQTSRELVLGIITQGERLESQQREIDWMRKEIYKLKEMQNA
jgi:hypothetical protein